MNHKVLTTLAVAAVIAVGGLFISKASGENKPASDPRIDKVIQQNEQILKNQAEIMKTLEQLRTEITQLRRRSS